MNIVFMSIYWFAHRISMRKTTEVWLIFFEQVEMTRAIGSNDLKAIRKVRKLLKKYTPDIVYAHSSKAGAIARIADLGLKNHLIYNPHGWAFNMKCSETKRRLFWCVNPAPSR